MPETLILNHLDEPHYLTSAWRQYDSTYIMFPNSGTIFSVRHWLNGSERSKYLDNLIDSYSVVYEEEELSYKRVSMAIGLGKRGNVFTISAYLIGGNLSNEELKVLADKAAEHHAKAVFMNKV